MNILGVNAVFHGPATALVINGEIIAGAKGELVDDPRDAVATGSANPADLVA